MVLEEILSFRSQYPGGEEYGIFAAGYDLDRDRKGIAWLPIPIVRRDGIFFNEKRFQKFQTTLMDSEILDAIMSPS